MINRISEIPFWGPEEQIRRFINQHDENIPQGLDQQTITQQRIENLDDIYQKQLIWSYNRPNVDDAYFYLDWCPIGLGTMDDPKWQISWWNESSENLQRDIDRTFNWRDFQGYQNSRSGDEMPVEYDASQDDEHSLERPDDSTSLEIDTLRHNIMKSYIEISEWLGDEAEKYGSHNGYVSRKMTMAWLFDAIRALINWKMKNQNAYAENDIVPFVGKERFLKESEFSDCGIQYEDEQSLDQSSGYCAMQPRVRSKDPEKNGTLKVRGNEWHYGERNISYTHNHFLGESRFYHNVRFLGQTTFDKEINGTALRSRWADLAEFREADMAYEPGTLVMFGGEKDITISDGKTCNAIVTTNPGLILNGDERKTKNMVGIALVGTVPVKIVGNVKKFDRLVPSRKHPGHARARRWYDFLKKPIGIALDDSDNGKVNCVTKLEF